MELQLLAASIKTQFDEIKILSGLNVSSRKQRGFYFENPDITGDNEEQSYPPSLFE